MSSGPTPSINPSVTTAAATLYCSPSGSDTNPGTLALPLRQPTEAIRRYKNLRIRHLIRVECAAGSYNGFNAGGLWFDPLDDGTACGFHIYGAMQAVTPATGTAAGTFDVVTAGTAATCQYTTWRHTGQTWTTNDLRGKLAVITGGTGVGRHVPIISNTADTLTVALTIAGAANGSTYSIQEPSSVVTTPVVIAGRLAAITGTPAAGADISAGIAVCGNFGLGNSSYIRIEQFKVELASPTSATRDVHVDSSLNQVTIERCLLVSSDGTALSMSGAGTQVSFNVSVAMRPIPIVLINCGSFSPAAASPSVFNMASCLLRSLGTGGCSMNAGGGYVGGVISNVQMDTDTMMIFAGPAWFQFGGIVKKTYTANNSFGLRARIASSGLAGTVLHLLSTAGMEISNCAAGFAFWLEGEHTFIAEGTLIGTNNDEGIHLAQGAKLKISAGSSITGTSAELSIDGTATTLAAMRALSPKVVPQPASLFGTRVWE